MNPYRSRASGNLDRSAHVRHRHVSATLLGAVVAAVLMFGRPTPAMARTLSLGIEQCDRAAAISAEAPRLSWAGARHPRHNHTGYNDDVYGFVTTSVKLTDQSALLMRFDLSAIPAGQRIVRAVLVVPVRDAAGNQPRFFLSRLLADWGLGVCYLYRSVGEKKVPWTRPGAHGFGSDRAARPTGIVSVEAEEQAKKVINVTEDVALWYSGRAPNRGWLLSVEDPRTEVIVASPLWVRAKDWILRITYEPPHDAPPHVSDSDQGK